ncbi:cytochrome c oxidase subunit 3 [Natronocella acetinitrilica]|uniref:cytochrome-c oxidase n=1 Tax=Natronocella acetinitrilica TaxID=414046 RepID=A0AAE3G534_9GAMM|nr:cytochrome c oxidase subunit 3 [Natronocella acetinitrilica]MCP1675209.1 cytochrome c oxidase subunit 3 [Natronocella acetinitrilica]
MSQSEQQAYYVPHDSRWPVFGVPGMVLLAAGFSGYLNGAGWGMPLMVVGAIITLIMTVMWFRDVIHESVAGKYNTQVDISFRQGMAWFIFSEVMFFGAFFGALFYARVFSIPWLGGEDPATSRFLWDSVTLSWPTAGPGEMFRALEFTPMGAWALPTINTLILLTSGVTLTIAHHAIKENHRKKVIWGLAATVALGALFMSVQIYEYIYAYTDLNLRLDTGIYGSVFFMLTGFHGVHVTIGAIALLVILFRVIRGHFTPDNHFGFEAAAWYWHFVDVVWLLLYVVVYLL